MEKGKTIHFRVTDSFYTEMTDLAIKCNLSLSSLTRNMVELGIRGWDDTFMAVYPLHNSKFLLLISWMYSQREPLRDKDQHLSLELVKYHKRSLDNILSLFEPHFKKLFHNVRIDLDRIVKESDELTYIIPRFGAKESTCYFDYDLYEKYLMHKSIE